jgi:predicted dehydrogenase
MPEPLRVGIAGMDHWYAGLGTVDQLARSETARLVALAHRDGEKARETAEKHGVAWSTDPMEIAQRTDVDLVVTACTTRENPDVCVAAARNGKHIVSVKPIAMTLAEGQRIADAVREAGVLFFPFESQVRLSAATRQYKQWIEEGRIGRPTAALTIMSGSVPRQDWPGRTVEKTWWMDPAQVPGGGWIDHSIYHIDQLRYLLGSEVERVSGEIGKLRSPDLELEDHGVATLRFRNGVIATVKVTWSAPPNGGLHLFHLLGTEGQIAEDSTFTGKLAVTGQFEPFQGWTLTGRPTRGGTNVIEHIAECLAEDGTPAAGVADGLRNLAVCLAFYDAARTGRVVEVPAVL